MTQWIGAAWENLFVMSINITMLLELGAGPGKGARHTIPRCIPITNYVIRSLIGETVRYVYNYNTHIAHTRQTWYLGHREGQSSCQYSSQP